MTCLTCPARVSAVLHTQTTSPDKTVTSHSGGERTLSVRCIFPERNSRPVWLTRAPVVLGRSDGVDVVLDGRGVSRQHAELGRDGPIVVVRDLGSMNGTFVNGQRVDKAPLSSGDLLRLGDHLLLVEEGCEKSEEVPYHFREVAQGVFGGPSLARVLESSRRLAKSRLPVVIHGEIGTGKLGMARAIHQQSGRRGPFVVVTCGALTEQSLEAELVAAGGSGKAGLLAAAEGGAMLLDGLTELSLVAQSVLLRLLEGGEVTPTGAPDVRYLATTEVPLSEAVRRGRLREGLAVFFGSGEVRVPPLRERVEEIPDLVEHFLRKATAGSPPEVEVRLMERLCLLPWPHNLRQLENTMHRLVVEHGHLGRLVLSMAQGLLDEPEPQDEEAKGKTPSDKPGVDAKWERVAEALSRHHGNVKGAAKELGISRQRIYRLRQQQPELDLARFRRPSRGEPA